MKLSFPVDNFLKKAAADSRLLPTHIALFSAIFYYSDARDPRCPFQVCRRKLMQFSRIRSRATYHKCMAELVAYRYITYEPSYDPHRASRVSLALLGEEKG